MRDRQAFAQQLRYLSGGGATFIVEYGSFLLFSDEAHLELHLALTLSFLVALVVGFAINHWWTFERDASRTGARLGAYTALALLNLGFNLVAVPGLGHLGVPHSIGKILAQSCVVAWNYLIMSRLIFRTEVAGAPPVPPG